MLIRRVEIRNIKNHEEREFNFDAGVTAICGPNGAGKTTIIEAIAWVLFDHLDYKREDFVRKGARKGSCSVTFVSNLDGREYSVYRDSIGTYYAYDTLVQARIAQQKHEVVKWLCTQHGVEPGTDLSNLFKTTIGVPQGTFTYDFMQSASRRKPVFDKILKVEEYARSADALKELHRHIEQKIAEIEKQISRDEGELSHYNEIVSEYKELSEKYSRLKSEHEAYKLQKNAARIKVEHYDYTRREIDRLGKSLQDLKFSHLQKAERHKTLKDELVHAKEAAQTVEQTQSGYELHLSSSKQLEELEQKRRQREQQLKERTQLENQQARIRADIDNYSRLLEQIENDRKELDALSPALEEFADIEQKRIELQKRLAEREQRERNLSKLGRELDQLRSDYARISKSVDEAEQYKDAPERVLTLETELQSLEDTLKTAQTDLERARNLQQRLSELNQEMDKWKMEVAQYDNHIKRLHESRWQGTPLPDLEKAFNRATKEVAERRAIIERDERMLEQITGGLCPLLSQKCLNMKEGQTLDDYFEFQLVEQREALKEMESVLHGLNSQLQQARNALSNQSTLDSYIATRNKLKLTLQETIEKSIELQQQFEQLGSISSLESRVQALNATVIEKRKALAVARDQAVQFARLEPLRQTLANLTEEGRAKRNNYDAEVSRLKQLSNLEAEQADLESRLLRLGNPRATAESLKRQISKEPQLLSEKSLLEAESEVVQHRCKALDASLEATVWIEAAIDSARKDREASRQDYESYIRNLQLSNRLPEIETELEQLEQDLCDYERQCAELQQVYDRYCESYSEAEHHKARTELDNLISLLARSEADLKYSDKRLKQLELIVKNLEDVRKRQQEKSARRDRLKELKQIEEMIRECLRKAGPYITEAYLHTISIEANQLYREITGNSIVSLRWEHDYEIVLEEGGRDRPFANLSGGEQMAAALSVRLALLKEFSDLRIAFFDEPTTNMDDERRRNLAQQIGQIKGFKQLFIVSHDDSFEGYTDSMIQL